MSWSLVPCLVALRSEFNAIAPGRDKASDGSVGDLAHQQSRSDHNPDETGNVPIRDADSRNEVHAVDVDADLKVVGMEAAVQHILARCRSGAENRLRYIIFNRRIWEASNGWKQRTYTGASPHTEHAHFSASYETAREADTSTWHLEDLVAITDAEIAKIAEAVDKKIAHWVGDVVPRWTPDGARIPDTDPNPTITALNALFFIGAGYSRIERKVEAQGTATAQVLSLVSELAGRDLVDEPAIAAAVLAGLPASAIVAAIPRELAKQVVDELKVRLAE